MDGAVYLLSSDKLINKKNTCHGLQCNISSKLKVETRVYLKRLLSLCGFKGANASIVITYII